MVDFNNETTIGTPAVDVVRILVLQRRADLLEALEQYNSKKAKGFNPGFHVVQARLNTLWLELQAAYKRRIKDEEEYNTIVKNVSVADDEEKILALIYKFNEYLDEIRLTRLDTKEQYDTKLIEKENYKKGL